MMNDHKSSLDGRFAEHGSRFEDMLNGHKGEMDARFDSHGSALDAHRAELLGQINSMSDAHGGKFDEMNKDFADQLAQLEQKHDDAIAAEKAAREEHANKFNSAISSTESMLQGSMDAHKKDLLASLDLIDGKHGDHAKATAENLAEADQKLKDQIAELDAKHQANIKNHISNAQDVADEKLRANLLQMESQVKTQMDDLSGKHADNAESHDALHNLFHEHKSHFDVSKAAHSGNREEAVDALKGDFKEQMDYMKQDITEAFQAALKDQAETGDSKHSDLQDLLSGQVKSADEQKASAEDQVSNLEEQLRAEMSSMGDEHDTHKKEHAAKAAKLMNQIDELQSKLEKQAAEHGDIIGDLKGSMDGKLGEHGANHDKLRDMIHGHKAEMQAELMRVANGQADAHSGALQALDGALKNDLQDHREVQAKAVDDLRKELGGSHNALTKLMSGHGGDMKDHKAEVQAALAVITGNHGKHSKAMDEMEAALRADLESKGNNHSALEAALKGHQEGFDAHRTEMQSELAKINGFHGKHTKAMDDMEAALRAELASHKNTHSQIGQSQEQIKADLERAKKDHAAFEANFKRQMEQMSGDHANNLADHQKKQGANHDALLKSHSDLNDMFGQHKSEFDKHKAALEDHKNASGKQMKQMDGDMRKLLGQLDDKHGDGIKGVFQSLKDHEKQFVGIEAKLKEELARTQETHAKDHNGIRELIQNNKKVLDEAVNTQKVESQGLRSSVFDNIEKLDDELREELRQKVGQVREMVTQESQRLRETLHDHKSTSEERFTREFQRLEGESGKFRAHTDTLDKALRREVSRVAGELSTNLDDYKNEAHKQHLNFNYMITEERQKGDLGHQEFKDRILVLEQMVSQDEAIVGGRHYVSRTEFKEETMRIWEAVDTHTHDMAHSTMNMVPMVSAAPPSIHRESGSISVTPRLMTAPQPKVIAVNSVAPVSPQVGLRTTRSPEPRPFGSMAVMTSPTMIETVQDVSAVGPSHYQVMGGRGR